MIWMIIDKFRLDGRAALVTGASRGLGAAIACALAEAGADVVCHGNSLMPSRTCELVAAAGRTAHAVTADLADPRAPERLFAQASERFGRIDILVNNAGMIHRAPAVDYSAADWNDVMQVNLSSVFTLSQLAGREMIARGWGKILNIASVLSFQGGITVPAYAASKGGLAQLTKALANEWASKNVNVNAIAPGYMETENNSVLRHNETRNRQIVERIPAGGWGVPEDLAGAAVFLCSDASRYVHGHLLVVDGGWLGR
jgi:2-deoxy-D-gluconate 3-dehydrogenase